MKRIRIKQRGNPLPYGELAVVMMAFDFLGATHFLCDRFTAMEFVYFWLPHATRLAHFTSTRHTSHESVIFSIASGSNQVCIGFVLGSTWVRNLQLLLHRCLASAVVTLSGLFVLRPAV
jgi:hypothetical protein